MTKLIDLQSGNEGVSDVVAEIVHGNAELLRRLVDRVEELTRRLDPDRSSSHANSAHASDRQEELEQFSRGEGSEISCLHQQIEMLQVQLAGVHAQVDQLNQQNQDLASKLADANVREVLSGSDPAEAMTWEERKKLIFKQMEDDCFDADLFVANLSRENHNEQSRQPRETPELFVERLLRDLESKSEEINELRYLLDQQSQTHDGQIAVGAAAIATMIDDNELIQQERQRLQQLQIEWEEKFRDGEIEASFERAKLSRERQELAKRQELLEEQLEDLKREREQAASPKGGSSRRWLVKLGLAED